MYRHPSKDKVYHSDPGCRSSSNIINKINNPNQSDGYIYNDPYNPQILINNFQQSLNYNINTINGLHYLQNNVPLIKQMEFDDNNQGFKRTRSQAYLLDNLNLSTTPKSLNSGDILSKYNEDNENKTYNKHKQTKLDRNRVLSRLRRLKKRNLIENLEQEISQMEQWINELEKKSGPSSEVHFSDLLNKKMNISNTNEKKTELEFQKSILDEELFSLELYWFEAYTLKWCMSQSETIEESSLKCKLLEKLRLNDEQKYYIKELNVDNPEVSYREFLTNVKKFYSELFDLDNSINVIDDTLKETLSLKQMREYSSFLYLNRPKIEELNIINMNYMNKLSLDPNYFYFPQL